MTHQEIIDRREALTREHGVAYEAERARIRKEGESLQELCGGLGHLFSKNPFPWVSDRRCCVFCMKQEG